MKKVRRIIAGTSLDVYQLEDDGKRFLFMLIPMGAPVAAATIEELNVFGVENFVFIGSCGSLSNDCRRSLIVPTKALRDEGTSYHYIAGSDEFVAVKTALKTASILDCNCIPYVSGPTWTTDCAYRETESTIEKAKSKGCLCVEMECSAIMAVSEYLNVNSYQILFTADMLSKDNWQVGRLKSMASSSYEAYLKTALIIAGNI